MSTAPVSPHSEAARLNRARVFRSWRLLQGSGMNLFLVLFLFSFVSRVKHVNAVNFFFSCSYSHSSSLRFCFSAEAGLSIFFLPLPFFFLFIYVLKIPKLLMHRFLFFSCFFLLLQLVFNLLFSVKFSNYNSIIFPFF